MDFNCDQDQSLLSVILSHMCCFMNSIPFERVVTYSVTLKCVAKWSKSKQKCLTVYIP